MYRFLSWMAIGNRPQRFLVVATGRRFSLPVIKWLAFAIGFGTLIVSGSIGFSYREHIPTVSDRPGDGPRKRLDGRRERRLLRGERAETWPLARRGSRSAGLANHGHHRA